jgi:hypothetical protein
MHTPENSTFANNVVNNESATCPFTGQGPWWYEEFSGMHFDGGASNDLIVGNIFHDYVVPAKTGCGPVPLPYRPSTWNLVRRAIRL